MGQITFNSFEDRDSHLRTNLKVPLPRRHDGPGVFYSDFLRAMEIFERPNYSLITPNPMDYLPFDRVRLILNAAFRLSMRADATEIHNVTNQFDLTHLTHRLVYTLSGGETLRVAMAKCVLESRGTGKLIMSAPWGVLSKAGRRYLGQLLEAYTRDDSDYQILCLEGDTSDEPDSDLKTETGVPFGIKTESLSISLSDAVESEYYAVALVDDFESSTLRSPCLIYGENGHGKSLLMKALAGCIPYTGRIAILGRPSQRVRLLFQDVSNQALLTGASADWTIKNDREVNRLNALLLNDVTHRLERCGIQVDRGPTLLSTKVAMIAIRLAEDPAALVLDEPDWGLSKAQAVALLRAVISLCNREEVPLLIISHRPWFDRAWCSRVRIERMRSSERGSQVVRLRVHEE